jgi:hypothetical protein
LLFSAKHLFVAATVARESRRADEIRDQHYGHVQGGHMAEQKSAAAPSPRRAQEPDNEALFVGAMAHPVRRRIAFNVVERNCRERFAEGDDGIRLYFHLLGRVRSAGVDEAVKEFENRFEPMLDQERLKEARRYFRS